MTVVPHKCNDKNRSLAREGGFYRFLLSKYTSNVTKATIKPEIALISK